MTPGCMAVMFLSLFMYVLFRPIDLLVIYGVDTFFSCMILILDVFLLYSLQK